jgi:hypothetical protein
MSDEMLRAMDEVLAISMLLKGTTPELMAAERQRQEEADELRAMEAGRVKVQQWMQSSTCVLSYLLGYFYQKLMILGQTNSNKMQLVRNYAYTMVLRYIPTLLLDILKT